MNRSITGFFACSACALAISSRTVWPLNTSASLPLAMMRIFFSSSWSSPNGGADQPTSTWPDMTCVSVDDGPPVATGFAFTLNCLTNAVTMPFVDDPFVEYASVLRSVSFSDLIGDVAGTYQKRSCAPVVSAPMTRTGARLENADMTPMTPAATPMSTLPEMTACCVSPPPCVYSGSSTRLYFLKMPSFWPISATDVSQLPRWPIASFSVSWANAGAPAANANAATTPATS